MRRQMKQHYLNVLHTCVHTGVSLKVSNINFDDYHLSHAVMCVCVYLQGQNPTCRRYGEHQHRENSTFTKDAGKDVEARAKPQGQRRGSSTATSDVILPKIVNRWWAAQVYCLRFWLHYSKWLCWSNLLNIITVFFNIHIYITLNVTESSVHTDWRQDSICSNAASLVCWVSIVVVVIQCTCIFMLLSIVE